MASDRVWLVRHGETLWSAAGRHTGTTDVPLTEEGEAEAVALRPLLADLRPSLVLTSPRQRARRTAELAGLTVDAVDDRLAEWDYGEYEGLTTPQIRETQPGWTIWTHPVPGGETTDHIAARADALLADITPRLADGPVVLVSHGHFSRVLAARWIGLPADGGSHLVLGTAAPCVLGSEHDIPALVHWNLPNPRVAS